MSKLNNGVDVVLDGETYTLKPSLKAATAICRQYGGYLGAMQAIASSDINAFLYIGQQGISKKSISSADLDEAIYGEGIGKLLDPFLRYLRILQNGGKEPVEDEEQDDDARDEGNDQTHL